LSIVFPFSGFLNYYELGQSFNKLLLNKFNFFYLHTVDNSFFFNFFKKKLNFNFFVYHGYFFNFGAKKSNLIIPTFSFFERDILILNIEGKLRKSYKTIFNNNDLLSVYDFFFYLNKIKECIMPICYNIKLNFKKLINKFFYLEAYINIYIFNFIYFK
jgi:hypothetical protein